MVGGIFERGVAFIMTSLAGRVLVTLALLNVSLAHAGFTPPQNLVVGQSATPSLDETYNHEAWVVYTYDIGVDGLVANANIHSSNDVTEVEDKILNHVNAMRFTPAKRDGKAVKVSVGPIVYTWILDQPREMTALFIETYQQAWDFFKQQDYDQAFELAAQLKSFPGRNAFEEIKFQILAASLASRWEDDTAELAHLKRIVEFQSLADRNSFDHPYVEDDQYLMILERIHSLQLAKMMIADGEVTLNKMMMRAADSAPTQRAKIAHEEASGRFQANPDVGIAGELTPLYRDGQGIWEARLSRASVSLSGVRGEIESVHLICDGGREQRLRFPSMQSWSVPAGWYNCKLEVAGRSGTRFTVHQLTTAPR